MKVDIRYIDEARPADRVVIHPIDEVRAKRDLAGKAWADEDTVLYYRTFHACRRQGIAAQGDFDSWLETVAEVEPHLSRKMVETAVIAGTLTEEQAAALYAQIDREEADGEGESPAPPS